LLRHGDRRHLAASDLVSGLDRLAVKKCEERDPGEGVDLAYKLSVDAQQAAPRGDEPVLALSRTLNPQRTEFRYGIRKPAPSFVLVDVTGLELDSVHLGMTAQERYVPGAKHRPFAEVGAKVMGEHAALDIRRLDQRSIQSNRLH